VRKQRKNSDNSTKTAQRKTEFCAHYKRGQDKQNVREGTGRKAKFYGVWKFARGQTKCKRRDRKEGHFAAAIKSGRKGQNAFHRI